MSNGVGTGWKGRDLHSALTTATSANEGNVRSGLGRKTQVAQHTNTRSGRIPEMNVLPICEILEICVRVHSLPSCAIDLVSSAVLKEAIQSVQNDGDDC